MDGRSIHSHVRREKRQEQAGGLGAGREGIEFGRDLGHEFRNHLDRYGGAAAGVNRRRRRAGLGDLSLDSTFAHGGMPQTMSKFGGLSGDPVCAYRCTRYCGC